MYKYLFALLLSFAFVPAATAQTTDEDARDDLDYYSTRNQERTRAARAPKFTDNLWYGTGAQLGFSSNGFSSFFNIGLSPIVGYKINNFLSVGPRASFSYNRYTQELGGGNELKEGFFTYSVGPFVRARVYRGFFVHGEYSIVNEVIDFDSANDFAPIRRTRAIPFAGGGLSQGGGPGQTGFEILILFRLTQPDMINESPFEFRTGVNYNF